MTADLDIVCGRGIVTALNLHASDLADPKSWHGLRGAKPQARPLPRQADSRTRARPGCGAFEVCIGERETVPSRS